MRGIGSEKLFRGSCRLDLRAPTMTIPPMMKVVFVKNPLAVGAEKWKMK
jgi:hypothetical protein